MSRLNPRYIIKSFAHWIAVHFYIFLSVLGVLLIAFANFELFDWPRNWLKFCESIGVAILAGGIFSSFLKILQFLKVFQSELLKVIFTDEYLKNRNDIVDLWKRVSRQVYKDKFPDICDELDEIITERYFPTKHKYYYLDYNLTSRIEIIDREKQYVKILEEHSLSIIVNNPKDDFHYEFLRQIPRLEGDEQTSVTIDSIKINGKEIPWHIHSDRSTPKAIDVQYITEKLSGCTKYVVVVQNTKIYSLKVNPFLLFQARAIIKNFNIQIQYPDDISLEFECSGTTHDFLSMNSLIKGTLTKRYNGIILPVQGFVISQKFC